MPTLIVETKINAAPEICFQLVRQASAETSSQIIHGDFEKGQTITFQSSFFGFKQTLIVEVTEFKKGIFFVDEMTIGNFKEFRHIHEFVLLKDSQTLLKDIFEWKSHFGIFSRIIDEIFLRKQFRKIVVRRNQRLKDISETKITENIC